MQLMYRTLDLIVEPAGAAGVAAILAEPGRYADRRVAVILSAAMFERDVSEVAGVNHMQLLYQTHSPYARKALVAAWELGLHERLEVIHHETSPTRRNEAVFALNPLARCRC